MSEENRDFSRRKPHFSCKMVDVLRGKRGDKRGKEGVKRGKRGEREGKRGEKRGKERKKEEQRREKRGKSGERGEKGGKEGMSFIVHLPPLALVFLRRRFQLAVVCCCAVVSP